MVNAFTMDDWQLIEAFVRERSEGSFQSLVERYAGLVQSSALRQTGDSQLAEDITQAVFTLLARKAPALRPGTVLSGWLFQTTRFVAQRAMRSERRRQRREQEAFDMQQLRSDEASWRQMAPVIDEALSGLAASDRNAVLLRYLEGRSLREVGTALGVTEEAAKKRVARATERLRKALEREGIAVSTLALGGALTGHAASAASAAFAATITTGAVGALGGAGATASGAALLVQDALNAWRWMKLKWAGSALVAVVVATFVWKGAPEADDATAGRPLTAVSAGANSVSALVDTAAEAEPPRTQLNFKHLALQVVGADSNEPITNAAVVLLVWRPGDVDIERKSSTDARGRCDVGYEPDAGRIDVGVIAPGWGARYATWPSEGAPGFATEYTFRLARITKSMGGVVQDPEGRPLAGVEIWFQGGEVNDYSQKERPRERFGFIRSVLATRTDSTGRWSLSVVPPAHPGFQLEGRHPSYSDTSLVNSGPQRSLDEIEDEKLRQLWTGRLVSRMQASVQYTGIVVDEAQRPIAGAHVQHNDGTEIFTTDGAGRFVVPKLAEGEWRFTVTAEGFAPLRTNAIIAAQAAPPLITLQTGAVLRVRVIDENQTDVPGAMVGLEQWGQNRFDFNWRMPTDFNGRLEWLSAPREVQLVLFAYSAEHCWTRDVRVQADGSEHTIRVHHKLTLHGRVFDAETGQALRQFKAVPGYGPEERFSYDISQRWYTGETTLGTNGAFKLIFDEKTFPWQVRVSADGYDDWTSGPLTNRIQAVIEVPMKRADPAQSIRGVVLGPDGTPAVGAQVVLLGFENNVRLRKHSFEGNKQWLRRTGPQGEFTFPANKLAHSVAALNGAGYAHQRVRDPAAPVELRLQAWGRVEGVVDDLAAAHGIHTIELYDPTADNYQGRVSLLGSYSVKADAERRFVFEDVPPGEFRAFVNSRNGVPYHHGTSVTVQPGETTQVTITEKPGVRVTGRFLAPAGQSINWTEEFVVSHLYADLPQASQFVDPGPKEELRKRELEFWTSPQGREQVNTPRVYSAMVKNDGSFLTLERLPPGKYRFSTVFKGASVTKHIEVNGEAGEMPLGEIRLQGQK